LRETVAELETQLSLPFSKRLKMRMKKVVKRFGESIGVRGETKLAVPVVERGREM
jgi:hypothetical protein